MILKGVWLIGRGHAGVCESELAVGILTAYTGLMVMSAIVIHQSESVHESAGAPGSSIARGQIGSQTSAAGDVPEIGRHLKCLLGVFRGVVMYERRMHR